jgi:hypothetical protein
MTFIIYVEPAVGHLWEPRILRHIQRPPRARGRGRQNRGQDRQGGGQSRKDGRCGGQDGHRAAVDGTAACRHMYLIT